MHGGDPDGVPTDHPGDTPDVTPDDLQGGDLDAALAVHCQPVLVKTGKGLRTLAKGLPERTLVFDDLAAVADQLLL